MFDLATTRRGSVPFLAFALTTATASVGLAQNYSLVIGVDGLGSYGLESGATANMHQIKDGTWAAGYRGACSLSAFTGGLVGTTTQQATFSGPGWSSIHSGVWTDKHLVTSNSFTPSNFAAYPSYLKVLEANLANVQTSGVVSWNPIDTYIFAPAGSTPNLDSRTATSDSDANVASVASTQLAALKANINAATFVHFDDVDHAGHNSGAYSAAYQNDVADVDAQVGTLLATIRSRPNFANENWQIILTADHGHLGTGGHGGQSQMERTMPILVSSKTLSAGMVTTPQHAASVIDIAPTVLNHFGVAIPAYMAGRSLSQVAAQPAVTTLGNGLVSHLAFDGNTNGTFAGTGGTAVGSVQYAVGRFGQAGRVASGGTGRVVLNDDLGATFGTTAAGTDFAFSLWMKYDSVTGGGTFFSNKNWNSGANTGINLAKQVRAGGGLDLNTQATGGTRRDVEPYGGLESGVWHSVIVNVDRDGQTSLYVDGALFGETVTSVGSFDGAFNWTLFNDGTGNFTGGSYTNLMIDEFSAWSRLLTPAEIAYVSTNPVPEPAAFGLIGIVATACLRRRRH